MQIDLTGAKVFQSREIAAAVDHARGGHLAVHLHSFIGPGAPSVFRREVQAGRQIAHVFHRDAQWLKLLARAAGVRRVVIERQGTDRQHVDLCAKPLATLLASIRAEGDPGSLSPGQLEIVDLGAAQGPPAS